MKQFRQNIMRTDSNVGATSRLAARMGTRARIGSGRFYQYRGVLLLSLAILVLWLNLTFLKPLIMGALFAIVLHPLMYKWKFLSGRPAWKAALITLLFTLGFIIPIGVLLFLGADAALAKIQSFQGLNFSLSGDGFSAGSVLNALGLRGLIEKLADISPLTLEQVKQIGSRVALAGGAFLVRVLQNFVADLPGILLSAVVILITLFFLLIDGPRAARFIRENSIFGEKQTERLFSVVSSLCYSVFVATIVSGAVQSALIGVSCLITGTPNVLLIVLVSFLASFFPVLGTAPVTLSLTAAALIQGDYKNSLIFLVFIVIVGLSDNVVRPYVLKGGAELHPLIGFVAAFGALDAIGFYGLFIGPVVAGLFFALLPMVTKTYSAGLEQRP